MVKASSFLIWTFASLSVLVALALPLGLYRASRRLGRPLAEALRVAVIAGVGAALWLGITAAAAAAGALTFTGTPPTMILMLAFILALAAGLGLSPMGGRLAAGLPLAALVGVHAFRFPLELIMHRAYEEGLMPVQMSYSGLNFDIVTGATAIAMAGLLVARRMPPWGVRLWNWMGLALLVNVVTIALLSAPTPLRVFMNEPVNVWVTRAPFVWLPAVMVLTALLGHIVVFRRLRLEARGGTGPVEAQNGENRTPQALSTV
jgi:hypothetical protein